jgi:hypothetical protein
MRWTRRAELILAVGVPLVALLGYLIALRRRQLPPIMRHPGGERGES